MNSEKFQHLLAQGFQSVIVNRPDHEPGNQITAAQLTQLPKPVLLICKSGARSTALFNQARNAGLFNE